jgi:hypothetical protein
MEKLELKLNKEELLRVWREEGHLKGLLNTYLKEPEFVTDEIEKNEAFVINYFDIVENIERIPLKCFAKESQDKLKGRDELVTLSEDEENKVFLSSHEDEYFASQNNKYLTIVVSL